MKQLGFIQRIKTGKYGDTSFSKRNYTVKFSNPSAEQFPLNRKPPSRASFIESKWDRMKINQMVQMIRRGDFSFKPKKREKPKEEEVTDIWGQTTEDELNKLRKMPPSIQAPKMKLPEHGESYNPSPEYLMTEQEKIEWKEMDEDSRPQNYIP